MSSLRASPYFSTVFESSLHMFIFLFISMRVGAFFPFLKGLVVPPTTSSNTLQSVSAFRRRLASSAAVLLGSLSPRAEPQRRGVSVLLKQISSPPPPPCSFLPGSKFVDPTTLRFTVTVVVCTIQVSQVASLTTTFCYDLANLDTHRRSLAGRDQVQYE